MGIKRPIVSEIAYHTWCINEYGMDAMFLLEGEKKALLIDTGTGVFDIPALVASITDKPCMVALTHGHTDHAGGMNMFPEVYLHEDDFDMAATVSVQDRRDYVLTMMGMSEGIYDISEDSVILSPDKAKMRELKEGDVIDLGKREVLVLETPGHTPGGLSYLDKKERIIYSGDACNVNTLLITNKGEKKKQNVSDLLATARKIESYHPYYDRHYNGHIGYASMVSCLPMNECLVRDAIELCEGLLDGSIAGQIDDSNPFVGRCLLARNRTMQILYREDQLK